MPPLSGQFFPTAAIRNVAIVGHSHCGKTSLAAALLFTAGATTRHLQVDEGNTITDFDEEEIARKLTISTKLASCCWKRVKFNLLDTPGTNIFLHDSCTALDMADAAIFVVDGVSGPGVSAQKLWRYAEQLNLPVLFAVNKLDRERANFEKTVDSIRDAFGRSAVPIALPIGAEKSFMGVIDLVRMSNIPAELEEQARVAHEELVETVAEGKDDLLEEFFSTGTIAVEHIVAGLQEEMAERRVFPIVPVAATANLGTEHLADFISEIFPSPRMRTGESILQVFKTGVDPAVGRISYFRVQQGELANDAHLTNLRSQSEERLLHVYTAFGKTLQPASALAVGDLGAATKLKDTLTGDTLAASASITPLDFNPAPEPSLAYAIAARSHADENRLSSALTKLLEEDRSLRFYRDEQTQEFLLSGHGLQHLEIVVSRLKRRFHVDVELKAPKIPYRETIRTAATAQGRHKKQSGGHGQFGDCHIRIAPAGRGSGFVFHNQIFGGAIPRQFIPAVQKGIEEAAAAGFVAGYPVVDFEVTLLDGSYHDVDSSEMAFKLAGRKAFRAAMAAAKPVILEPLMNVDIETPTEFAGDLMSDISTRRGRICGTDSSGSAQVIRAQVPLAELLTYSEALVSITQGRGSFHMEFDHYDLLPANLAAKLVESSGTSKRDPDDE